MSLVNGCQGKGPGYENGRKNEAWGILGNKKIRGGSLDVRRRGPLGQVGKNTPPPSGSETGFYGKARLINETP